MKKVLLNFIGLPIVSKIAFYRNVIAKMTGNAHFPNPDRSLADAETATDNLEAAMLANNDGGHGTTVALHKREAEADVIFRLLAAYVDRIAAGDEDIILSGGFQAWADRSLFQKAELSVVNGTNSGWATVIAKAIADAGAYIWQQAFGALPTDDKAWIIAGYSTQADFDISGLTPGVVYWFRMAAITPDGVTDFCAAVSIMMK